MILIQGFVLINQVIYSQDAFSSHLDKSDLFINPANSNIPLINSVQAKVFLSYRDQWNALSPDASYRTAFVEGDFNMYRSEVDAWNISFILMNDRADQGNLQQNMIQLSSAYTRRLSGNNMNLKNSLFMSAGAAFAINQVSTNFENLWFGRQFDTNLLAVDLTRPSGENFIFDNISFFNLNLGLRWIYIDQNYNQYSTGLSINNINKPNISLREDMVPLQPKLTFFFESILELNDVMVHKPGIQLSYQSPSFQLIPSYLLGFNVNKEDSTMDIGVASRISNSYSGVLMDSIILLLGLSNKGYRIGFSFDFNVSPLSQFTNGNGALEISFDYTLPAN